VSASPLGIKRAAIYARVSSDDQAKEGTSLGTQRERCLEYVAAQGWAVVPDSGAKPDDAADVFQDKGVSGAKGMPGSGGKGKQREALGRLVRAAERGEVEVLVVTKWDRLSRSIRHLTDLWGRLEAAGVECISLGDPESSGRRGRLVRHLMASIAEDEREAIRERTTLGRVARLREDGGWSGGEPPLGFRVQGQGRTARLVLDEQEAAMIRRAVSLLLDGGMTTGQAADALNAEGYLPRKAPRWTAALLRNHLMRGPWGGVWTYAKPAKRRNGRDLIPDPVEVAVPAMLEPDRYAALLAYLSQTASVRVREVVHPLSGLVVGLCGHTYTGIARRDRGNRRYRCAHAKSGTRYDRCDGVTLLADHLDAVVWAEVMLRLRDPDRLIAEAEERLGMSRGAAAEQEDAYVKAEARVAECERALGGLLAAAVRGGWDESAQRQAKVALDADLVEARQHLAMVAAWRQETAQAAEQVAAMREAAKHADVWEYADAALRAQVLRLFQVRFQVTACDDFGRVTAGTLTGLMDHSLLAADVSPDQRGVLSLLNRTSR
jgi:DNA invertase Pin-like site-specific DNA recombinase